MKVTYSKPVLSNFLFFTLILAILLVIEIEVFWKDGNEKYKYRPYMYGNRIPFLMLILLALYIWIDDNYLITLCFNILPTISIYYALIIFLSSFLRKRIQRRSMIILWLMPTLLLLYRYMHNNAGALYYFTIPKTWLTAIIWIWMIGFILVFLYKIISHLVVRKNILKFSHPIHDEKVLTIWEKEWEVTKKKKNSIGFVTSSTIASPLTIGLFDATTYVVLPHINYTEEELQLILRHEILHICRKDVGSKFFIAFINALCWYNPFMWMAMRKCSEDIELSCDEIVLENEDDATRKLYANIILDNTQSEVGFTSALSTQAKSLRYRLKNIIINKKLESGSFIVAILFVGLTLCSNLYAVTYGEYSGKEIIYQDLNPNDFEITYFNKSEFPYMTYEIDEDNFNSGFNNLTFHEIGRDNYALDTDKPYIIYIDSEDYYITLRIHENIVGVSKIKNDHKVGELTYYYTKEKVNFEKLIEDCIKKP